MFRVGLLKDVSLGYIKWEIKIFKARLMFSQKMTQNVFGKNERDKYIFMCISVVFTTTEMHLSTLLIF